MKEYSEKLSSLIDNELDDKEALDMLLNDPQQQQLFSRYQMIGDALRDESSDNHLCLDVTDSVMAAIEKETQTESKVQAANDDNVISFAKRFGQYAIAASVAGVAVIGSVMLNNDAPLEQANPAVLNTVPFGGAAPVSLEAPSAQTEKELEEQQERLEALLKDHQLQLQRQP